MNSDVYAFLWCASRGSSQYTLRSDAAGSDNSFVLSYLHHLYTDFCSGCKGSSFSTFGPAFMVLLFIDNYFEPNELESQTEIGGTRQENLYKPANLGERGRDSASVTAMANGSK